MKRIMYFVMMALTMSMTSCTDDNANGGDPGMEIKPIPQALSRVQQTDFAQHNNVFANKLFAVLSAQSSLQGQNVCLAPTSMQQTFSILANGLEDDFRDKVVQAMGFESIDELNMENLALLNKLGQDDEYVKVALGNSLWIDKKWGPVKPAYASDMQKYYNATIDMLNIFNNVDSVQNVLNAWAKEMTNNVVSEFPMGIHNDTKMVVATINCYEGKWAYPFNPAHTELQSFYNIDGKTKQVMTMSNTEELNAFVDKELKMLELPYGQGYYSMILVMPTETEKLDSIAANADWWAWHEKMAKREVSFTLPRFSINTNWYHIEDLLPELGMPEAMELHLEKAMPKMTQLDMIHQTVALTVDESGTKAVTISSISGDIASANEIYISFNKPFIFAIRENTTGAILFMGKVVKL